MGGYALITWIVVEADDAETLDKTVVYPCDNTGLCWVACKPKWEAKMQVVLTF